MARILVLLAAAAVLVLGTLGLVVGERRAGNAALNMPFDDVDEDMDGYASKAEVETFLMSKVKMLDSFLAGNDRVDKEAIKNKLRAEALKLFNDADKDGDGRLSKAEYDASIEDATARFVEVMQSEIMNAMVNNAGGARKPRDKKKKNKAANSRSKAKAKAKRDRHSRSDDDL